MSDMYTQELAASSESMVREIRTVLVVDSCYLWGDTVLCNMKCGSDLGPGSYSPYGSQRGWEADLCSSKQDPSTKPEVVWFKAARHGGFFNRIHTYFTWSILCILHTILINWYHQCLLVLWANQFPNSKWCNMGTPNLYPSLRKVNGPTLRATN